MDDFLVGNGLFDISYKCNDTEEELLRYLGLSWKSTLTDRIEEHDRETFFENVEKVIGGAASATVRIRFNTASGETRNCRVRIFGYKNEHFHIEIADIENACDGCYNIMQEQRSNEWLLAQQGTILFEYTFATEELDIYKYSYNGKLNLNNALDFPQLVEAMTADLKTSEINVVYRKTFEIRDHNYQVTGMVRMMQSEKISLFGLIKEGRNDEAISNWGDTHDAMTGIFNKPFALSRAKKMVEEQGPINIALVMIDLDDFKSVNDTYGHIFGDKVLQRLSQILYEASKERGFAARFGGDEFFMCLLDLKTEDELRAVLQSVQYKFRNSFPHLDRKFTLSIGVSEYPRNSRNYDILMKKADKAVYIAKSKGKARYIIYKEELHGDIAADGSDNVKVETASREIQRMEARRLVQLYTDAVSKDFDDREAAAGAILSSIMSRYGADAVTVYSGPEWKPAISLGTYENAPVNAPFMFSDVSRRMFGTMGTCQVNLNHVKDELIEPYAETLRNYGITTFRMILIGDVQSPKALFSYDSIRDIGGWPSEEINDLIFYSHMLYTLIKK